jgi:hypothetical protein
METQALHQALLCPEAYPGESGPISYRETHISRLYFTAHHVYKVKKAVDFGFLNFTSLDRRRFYCHEEVRLNGRFCPDTYLGVAEIRRKKGRIVVNGPGEIVDYAVRMKRLPEDRMLVQLLRRDDPGLAREVARLARRLAGLHRESEICRKNGGTSNLETVRVNWRENFAQTAPFAGKTLSPRTIELCSDYASRFLETHGALLLEREAKGFVREGHGDLHAEHICLTDPVCIYDCIEFNRRFRVADLAADLAFLLMDLDFRGRRDLADRLLEEYDHSMGKDRDLPALLPFYKLYRAYVRGKVESFLSEETAAGPAMRQEAAARAKRYFNLALGYLCPPLLGATCGLMGVGKTTVGKELAESLGAVLLRSDELRKELSGLEATAGRAAPFGQGIYSPERTRRTYDLLWERSRQCLAAGKSVIVDASFSQQAERERFRRAAQELGMPFCILLMECDERSAIGRLDRRQALGMDASDGRRELYAQQAEAFQPLPEARDIIRVDTDRDVDYNVNLILCAILERIGLPS